tara:strand:- start:8953 stop:10044 length:1092 start_codon:yes stop_codon:yes gene_type:complete
MNKHKINKKNKSYKKRGGFLNKLPNLPFKKTKKVGFAKQLNDTKASETQLLNTYDSLTQNVNNYYKSYNNHLQNLITLEDFVNLDSLDSLFKDIVIKKHFKREDIVDRSNPLLINNYLVDDDTSPNDFRREHLIKQIRYKLYQEFPDREQTLITDIDVKKKSDNIVLMIITTVEDKEYKRSMNHNNFVLQMSQIRKELKDIISSVKKNLKYESNIHKYDESSIYSSLSNNSSNLLGKSNIKNTPSNNTLINRNNVMNNNGNNGNNNGSVNIFNNLSNSNNSIKPRSKSKKEINIPLKFNLAENINNIPENNKKNILKTGPINNRNCEEVKDEMECRNMMTNDGRKKCFYDRIQKKCTKNKKII